MSLSFIPSQRIWPAVIICSALASGIFFFLGLASPLRLMTTFWFLLVCPGMAFVRLLRLDESYYEWTLAIALSISLDAIIACLLLYTGFWSIELGLSIVIAMSVLGAFLQIWMTQSQPLEGQSLRSAHQQRNIANVLICPRCEAQGKQTKAGFSRSGRQRYRCGQCKRIYTPDPRRNTNTTEILKSVIPMEVKENKYRTIRHILKDDQERVTHWVRRYAAKLPFARF